jgi:DNA repair protein RadA/Sms
LAYENESQPQTISQISVEQTKRIQTGDAEFDRVLGGGIVPGSITLIGGHPGIGKSTLLLQVATAWQGKSLYVSGEESSQQIKLRADRLGGNQENCFVLPETNLERIIGTIKHLEPDLIVIDSIQTIFSNGLESSPGTVSQVRDCTTILQRLAKESQTPIIIIGHITKDGSLAGPKVLEHIVDTVLQFEGDRHFVFRLLRTSKNRFGSTDELGIYEMGSSGLSIVSNPSKLLINQGSKFSSGNTVGATLEGMRPILIETQALVSDAVYGTPQRSTTGFELRRLHMLLAVLQKRCGLFFGQSDVFLNIAGGIKVTDPAIDLAVLVALVSSHQDLTVSHDSCFAGEVGLSGEIRSVNRLESRILEAERLGFQSIYVSKYHAENVDFRPKNIEIRHVADINELYDQVFVS